MERLNKYIARSGIASRRGADSLIEQGKVKLNGKVMTKLGMVINPNKDKIEYKNKLLVPQTDLLFAFYKPKGVTSTMRDKHADKTIADYFKDVGRVYPVGRLDKESEGLMIVTNNGDLAQKLMHPKYRHEREYEILVSGNSEDNLADFENRHRLDGYRILPMEYKLIKTINNKQWLISLVLKEGRKRQIREVARRIGYKINRLKRIRINKLTLQDLNPGEFKTINPKMLKK